MKNNSNVGNTNNIGNTINICNIGNISNTLLIYRANSRCSTNEDSNMGNMSNNNENNSYILLLELKVYYKDLYFTLGA